MIAVSVVVVVVVQHVSSHQSVYWHMFGVLIRCLRACSDGTPDNFGYLIEAARTSRWLCFCTRD